MSRNLRLVFEIPARDAICLLIAKYILLAFLVLIGIIIGTILFVPLYYELDAAWDQLPDELHFSLRNCIYGINFNWQNRTLRYHLLFFSRSVDLGNNDTAPAKKPARKLSKMRPRLDLIRDLDCRNAIRRMVLNLWRTMRPQQMFIKAWIGFDEPHYTGWLMGLISVLSNFNNAFRIDVTGVWDEPCFKGEFKATGRFFPARLLGQVLIFIMHPKIRPAIKQLRLIPAP